MLGACSTRPSEVGPRSGAEAERAERRGRDLVSTPAAEGARPEIVLLGETGAPVRAGTISWTSAELAATGAASRRPPDRRRWTIAIAAPGFAPTDRSVSTRGGGRPVVVILEPAWTVGGRVTDTDGRPIAGAQIYLAEKVRSVKGARYDASWTKSPVAVSDASGGYLVSVDAAGSAVGNLEAEASRERMAIGAAAAGYGNAISTEVARSAVPRHCVVDLVLAFKVGVRQPDGNARAAIEDCPLVCAWPPQRICAPISEQAELTTAGELTPVPAAATDPPAADVLVVDRIGRPIPGASVRWESPPEFVEVIGADGTRTVHGAGPARGRLVTARAADYVPLTRMIRQFARGAPVVMGLSPGRTVRGRVTDESGEPVAGALVQLGSLSRLPDAPGMPRRHRMQPVLTDASGFYEIVLRPALAERGFIGSGDGDVVAWADGYIPAAQVSPVESSVGLVADVVLRTGRRVRGRVVWDDDGAPIDGTAVQLCGASPEPPPPRGTFVGRSDLHVASTSDGGRFAIDGCPPDRAEFVLISPLFGAHVVTLELGGDDAEFELRVPRRLARSVTDDR